jgi:nickel-dependent lactate racemase
MDQEVKVEINQQIVDGGYDLILSIGQVVPHEVVGMANHSKNVLVGCGGSEIINFSHILGAFYGMERLMGKDFSPVRLVFDYAADHFLKDLPLSYILTVTTAPEDQIRTHGLFIGRDRSYFEQAVALSQEKNIIFLDKPIKKALVYLDPKEFKSTWLGNKSIYRTRMAIADGGDLIVLAPGVDKFGEDEAVDALIRKYGYCGRKKVIELCRTRQDLADNLAAAAHLIHGSSDDRFKITYCTKLLSQEEIEGVHFDYVPYEVMRDRYNPDSLVEGYNTMPDGEEIFYISNPALGLWIDRGKFA